MFFVGLKKYVLFKYFVMNFEWGLLLLLGTKSHIYIIYVHISIYIYIHITMRDLMGGDLNKDTVNIGI